MFSQNMNQLTTYTKQQLFVQMCQYKVFQVNLKRVILKNDYSNFKKVRLINSEWFKKWKKISCYEAIKDELDMSQTIEENYSNIKEYYETIVKNLEITDYLEPNINNNSIVCGYDNSLNRCKINPNANFEIISPELWNSFVPPNTNNINNGTLIELDVEYLTKMALMINLDKNSCYIVFWNIKEDNLEKIILIFPDEGQRFLAIENLKTLGINNFYACYLEDLVDEKYFSNNNFSFTCRCRTGNKKLIKNNFNNNINNNLTNNYNNNTNNNNFNNNFNNFNNNFNYDLPVGLDNIFLTCYMNSALQSLVNIEKLSNFFLQNKNLIDENNNILSYAYLQVVENLLRKTSESQFISSYKPIEFQSIASINPLFNGAGDSIDMINFFLQTIHKELNFKTDENLLLKYLINNPNNNMKYINLNNSVNNFISNNNSIITNTFYLLEKSRIKCSKCKRVDYSFQFLSYIILPLEEIRLYKLNNFNINQNYINIIEGLDFYRRQCPLVGDNCFYCNYCQMNCPAFQYSSFYSLPKVLIINLNRGHGNIYKVGIQFPEKLNLTNYAETTVDNNSNYKLISIITHFGESGVGGHFIAFCFVKNKKKWYKFNDSMVTESNFQEAASSGDTYILFYERQ